MIGLPPLYSGAFHFKPITPAVVTESQFAKVSGA